MISQIRYGLAVSLTAVVLVTAWSIPHVAADLVTVIVTGATLDPNNADPWGLGGPTPVGIEMLVEATDTNSTVNIGDYSIESISITINGVTETSTPAATSTLRLGDFSLSNLGDQVTIEAEEVEYNGGLADIRVAGFYGEFITFADELEDLPVPTSSNQVGSSGASTSDYDSGTQNGTFTTLVPVPEPTAVAFLSIAITSLVLRRRRIG